MAASFTLPSQGLHIQLLPRAPAPVITVIVSISRRTVRLDTVRVGLARTIYIRCMYGIFGRESHQIYGHVRCIYTRFWPTLGTRHDLQTDTVTMMRRDMTRNVAHTI